MGANSEAYIEEMENQEHDGKFKGEKCPFCNGNGYVIVESWDTRDCGLCNGSGIVQVNNSQH
jgi:DnaJ-class molecular chaperone